MANKVTIGELGIDLKLRIEALEKNAKTVQKRIKEIEEENKNLVNSNKELDASWIAISATAILTVNKVINVVKDATEEYKAHTQSMEALKNVASYTNNDMIGYTAIMEKYKGVLEQTDLADTIKNFSLMGMSVEDTDKMIQALTNSAIRNRNANYTVSQAVKVASDGYKQGLSTLSDSAGVTENLSVMVDNYAKSIGKTASQLTEEEKNQAYLNRTMLAAEPFMGAMEGYLDSLAGKQAQYSQAMKETKIAYGEALEPTLQAITEAKTKLISLLGNFINENKEATAGLTTFGVAMAAGIVVILAAKKAKDAYAKSTIAATIAEKGFTAALKANPLTAILVVVSSVLGVYTAYKTKAEELAEAQSKLNEITERYNKIQNGTYEYSEENISKMQEEQEAISNQLTLLKAIEGAEKYLNENVLALPNGIVYKEGKDKATEIENNLKEYKKQLKECREEYGNFGETSDEVYEAMMKCNNFINEGTTVQKAKSAVDTAAIKTQQQEAAQLSINAAEMQKYLDVVKKGNTSTSEYQDAIKALSKEYPEAAKGEAFLIDVAQDQINAQKLSAEQAWTTSQETINANIEVVSSFLEMAKAAENDELKQQQLAETIGISYNNIIPTLTSVLNILTQMGDYTPESVPNIAKKSSYSGSSSYSNKRLDNYKKEIAHKKAMDQISIQEEINMYQYALNAYAKTTDEKRELREKIYELNKQLANKEKEMLDQQTEDYEVYIQQQINNRGAEYDIDERTKDYNKIIAMHKSYLNQIMKDERLSLEERQEIYREELSIIRDYEQQKRDLRVEQIDNTVSNLTDAITKQLEEMQEKDKKILDENLKVVEEWKNARINAINEEYDARIEAINKELEALDKAEQQKTRDEEDAEYEKKKQRLEELVAFEHDAVTKANYQKELDKLIAEYQKTLDKRALEDKKEALSEQKELLQQEQESQVQSIEKEAERQTEIYEKQLDELEKYYSEQIDMAQKTAENMLLNVEQNQDKILNLLQSYGDAYEITGQSLGEKLAQGINEGIANKIQNFIANIENTIDAKIEAQIARMASSVYRYEAGEGKSEVKSITTNVVQNNYIEQNPETPSETYRKLENVSQSLAAEISGA